MKMEKRLIKDVIWWDTVNWAKAISYWEKQVDLRNKNYKCLELGASKGGLSLWLAKNNNQVICSDLNGPERDAYFIHAKYNCLSKIEYASIDATRIPFENHFDIVVFKSILGGISGMKGHDYQTKTINEIYKALKPGGKLLFAENLEASPIHKYFRRKFGTENWDYLRINEINSVFSSFSSVDFTTVGFFGCFGLNNSQRDILGSIDTCIEKIIPASYKYIVIGVAVK